MRDLFSSFTSCLLHNERISWAPSSTGRYRAHDIEAGKQGQWMRIGDTLGHVADGTLRNVWWWQPALHHQLSFILWTTGINLLKFLSCAIGAGHLSSLAHRGTRTMLCCLFPLCFCNIPEHPQECITLHKCWIHVLWKVDFSSYQTRSVLCSGERWEWKGASSLFFKLHVKTRWSSHEADLVDWLWNWFRR
jgi:hypothetical protein